MKTFQTIAGIAALLSLIAFFCTLFVTRTPNVEKALFGLIIEAIVFSLFFVWAGNAKQTSL